MIGTKYCKQCKKTKALTEFSIDRKLNDNHNFYCKDCCNKYAKKYRESPRGIYQNLKGRSKHYDNYSIDMTRKEFIEWESNTPRICVYCDISEDDLWIIQDNLGSKSTRLTIDCMKPNHYSIDNIVWACDRCNVVKGHQFTFEQMREIGQKYIKPYWEKIKEETKNE